jgi:CTP synthase (UTP-ammonia lyase)
LEPSGRTSLDTFDALWCVPGSPFRSMTGALNAIRFARESDRPLIGTCAGFQHIVIEYARNVLGFADAQHAEYDASASTLFVTPLSCSLAGGVTLWVKVDPESRAGRAYQTPDVQEQYYCNFGLNPEYQALLHDGGLKVVGRDKDGEARVVELPDHRFFIGTLYVPQLNSAPEQPHPLVIAYLEAAVAYRSNREPVAAHVGIS